MNESGPISLNYLAICFQKWKLRAYFDYELKLFPTNYFQQIIQEKMINH